jgi:hypothetical protein
LKEGERMTGSNLTGIRNRLSRIEKCIRNKDTGVNLVIAESDGTWTTGDRSFKTESEAVDYLNQKLKYQTGSSTIIIDDVATRMVTTNK